MANNQDYWTERARRMIEEESKLDAEVLERVRQIISMIIQDIEKEIYTFYAKYASKEGVTIAEAKKKIGETDIREFEDRVKRYVESKDFSDKANKELRQYNTKMYVSREQLLKQQLGVIFTHGTALVEREMYEYMTEAVNREVLRQSGILGHTVQIKPSHVRAIVNASFQGMKWSTRLWQDMTEVRTYVEKTVSNVVLRGRHPNEFVPELKKKMGVTTSQAKRLLITETARVQTEAQKLSYIENSGEDSEYEYVAKLDEKTSDTCRGLNGKVFKVKDMTPGVNAPPMHPHCRSTTVPHVGDWRKDFFKKRKGKYNMKMFEEE
ncbi:minor capsid protein [Staphylococcus delphini]|uniref:minor capsid protein n=1 Tax=Staphylococcus delphini TaxID=53344 RepID=UPI000BBB7288|nr:minor capsid protein [Staphylococcus delphini]PCF40113.1 phage head morphogenesis protein [Staphylococcus delphini]PCF45498.1 phage head morphogenesis protein [Staphylococcus delphini]PCF53882.1 phage head morphogenesis protein [Staphylococcus delphini]PCF59042.1 phage head morphogenesis protein [Staphylococcus delphini]PCF60335.1 phage head morphogenesis protein [Staphylococcus delphini]